MWISTKPGTTVCRRAMTSRQARGTSTVSRGPTATILLPWTTTTASEISSKGVNARGARIATGCIRAGNILLETNGNWESPSLGPPEVAAGTLRGTEGAGQPFYSSAVLVLGREA